MRSKKKQAKHDASSVQEDKVVLFLFQCYQGILKQTRERLQPKAVLTYFSTSVLNLNHGKSFKLLSYCVQEGDRPQNNIFLEAIPSFKRGNGELTSCKQRSLRGDSEDT